MTTKKLTLSLAAATAIGVIAVGAAVANASVSGSGPAVPGSSSTASNVGSTVNLAAAGNAVRSAAGDSDAEIAKECVQASQDIPDPANWRPGARIDLDAENGFLVIRNDQYASICVIKNGQGVGTDPYGVSTRHVYGNLTAARPFDYLTSYNFGFPATAAIHFGIATSDVTAVSLVGPDNSVTPAVVRDGTFLAKSNFPEAPFAVSNNVRATLKNGQVIEGPLRTVTSTPPGGSSPVTK